MKRSDFSIGIGEWKLKIFEGVQDLLREALFPEWSFCEVQREWADRQKNN